MPFQTPVGVNAALETGGNLDALVSLDNISTNQLVNLLLLILVELRVLTSVCAAGLNVVDDLEQARGDIDTNLNMSHS